MITSFQILKTYSEQFLRTNVTQMINSYTIDMLRKYAFSPHNEPFNIENANKNVRITLTVMEHYSV